jgi:hypothetical protein
MEVVVKHAISEFQANELEEKNQDNTLTAKEKKIIELRHENSLKYI